MATAPPLGPRSFSLISSSSSSISNPSSISPFSDKKAIHLLVIATKQGNLNRLKDVIAKNDGGRGLARTILDAKGKDGQTILHSAAGMGKKKICTYLLEELKLDVDLKNNLDDTPFSGAVAGGHLDAARYLFERGANPASANISGFTPLHYAALQGYKKLLSLILSHDVKVDPQCNSGNTPLVWAATRGKVACIKILLEHGADPNMNVPPIFSPLMAAIVSGSLKCIKLLIKEGANVNINLNGLTPLALAYSEGNTKIIKCLLKASGADRNIIKNGSGRAYSA